MWENKCPEQGIEFFISNVRTCALVPSAHFFYTPLSCITLHINELISSFGLLMCVRKKCCVGG